jgi:hypothetical protein
VLDNIADPDIDPAVTAAIDARLADLRPSVDRLVAERDAAIRRAWAGMPKTAWSLEVLDIFLDSNHNAWAVQTVRWLLEARIARIDFGRYDDTDVLRVVLLVLSPTAAAAADQARRIIMAAEAAAAQHPVPGFEARASDPVGGWRLFTPVRGEVSPRNGERTITAEQAVAALAKYERRWNDD